MTFWARACIHPYVRISVDRSCHSCFGGNAMGRLLRSSGFPIPDPTGPGACDCRSERCACHCIDGRATRCGDSVAKAEMLSHGNFGWLALRPRYCARRFSDFVAIDQCVLCDGTRRRGLACRSDTTGVPRSAASCRIRSNPKRDSPACQPRRGLRFWQTGIIQTRGLAAACYFGLGKDLEDFRWSRP